MRGHFLRAAASAISYDANAQSYITAVETADGQALEVAVKNAINAFVVGCKADGIWTAIKASCILAGARTQAGSLVPLVGPAPTEFGTAGGWNYNRKTGTAGNGTNNYLNSNRSNNADPQDNNHNSCWVAAAGPGTLMASSPSNAGQNYMDLISAPTARLSSRSSAFTVDVVGAAAAGLYGHSRNSSSQMIYESPQARGTRGQTSQTTENANVLIYARGGGATPDYPSLARIAFYSIGESLDLGLLNARLTTLMAAYAAAIP